MSRFAGVEKEGPKQDRLPKLTPGEYLLEVTENKIITTKTGDAMVRSFKVKEAIGEGAVLPGSEASAKLLYFSTPYVSARIAEYIRGLTNAQKVDTTLCDQIFGETNPAKGKLIKVLVTSSKSAADKDYLRYDWRYVADDEKPVAKKK